MEISSEKKAKLIDKIQKCLSLATSSNPHEAQLAEDTAARLMADYSISMVEIRENGTPDNTFVKIYVDGSEVSKVRWESTLAGVIAKAFDCRIVNTWGSRREWVLCFLGTNSDVSISIYFFKYLRRTVGTSSERAFTRRVDVNTFAYGMVTTIGERLERLYKRRNEVMDSNCKALVVVKQKGLGEYVHKEFPNLVSSGRATLSGSQESWRAGQATGNKVRLDIPIENGKSNAQIGR